MFSTAGTSDNIVVCTTLAIHSLHLDPMYGIFFNLSIYLALTTLTLIL